MAQPLSRRDTCHNPWIIEAFLDGTMGAVRRKPRTGFWESRTLAWRSDVAVVRSLRDGRRREVAIRLLILDKQADLRRDAKPSGNICAPHRPLRRRDSHRPCFAQLIDRLRARQPPPNLAPEAFVAPPLLFARRLVKVVLNDRGTFVGP